MFNNYEVDWNIFSCKFSGKEQQGFEHLAYLLFCIEFKLPYGLFGFYNQIGIETEPVEHDGEVIGFQAKYYSATVQLSSKISELKRTVENAKNKNPALTKILLYTNKEITESKKVGEKKPEYQKAIESYAKSLGITFEWRVKSNFKAILSLSPDISIKDYFFNPNSGIKEMHSKLMSRKKEIISLLENEICFNKHKIAIHRSDEKIIEFLDSTTKYLIICGESGAGKSGMLRKFVNIKNNADSIFVFNAIDFYCNSFSEFLQKFGSIGFEEFFSAFSENSPKVIIVDAAEKIFANSNNILKSVIVYLVEKGWKFIFTIRASFVEQLKNYILDTNSCDIIEVNNITVSTLKQQLQDIQVVPPKNENLQLLICNLFYLKLYLQTYSEDGETFTRNQFYTKVWDVKIKGQPYSKNTVGRETFICSMFDAIAENNAFYCADENDIAQELVVDGVISYDSIFYGYHFWHDAFEGIVARFIFEQKYKKALTLGEFYGALKINFSIRKYYRQWLLEKLSDDLSPRIPEIFTTNEINKIWQDETLLALLTDEKTKSTILSVSSLLSADNFALLKKAVFLLNTACHAVDKVTFLRLTTEELGNVNMYRFTKPAGVGWEFVIGYIYENIDIIDWSLVFIYQVTDMLKTYLDAKKTDNPTMMTGKIALHLYRKYQDSKDVYKKDFDKNLFKIITFVAHEIKDEIILIFDSVIQSPKVNRQLHLSFPIFQLIEFRKDSKYKEIWDFRNETGAFC